MNKAEKIKAEIDRLKNELVQEVEKGYKSEFDEGRISAFEDMITFIDSLEEEPVSEDLEKACDEYYDETWDEHGGKAMVVDGCHDIWFPSQATDDFFKAGAKWQKERDQSTIELAEDHAYLAGQEKIIAKACEWLENYFKGVSSGTVYLEDFKKAIKE